MTAPKASGGSSNPQAALPQLAAPNGILLSGQPADSVDTARDDMINEFLMRTSDLTTNANYYGGAQRPEAVGIAVPTEMQKLLASVGYPRIYVDSISDRLELEGFTIGGTTGSKSTSSGKPAAPKAPAANTSASPGNPGEPIATSTPQADQLWDWWQANNLDVEAPLGHTEALVHGRAYITISVPDPQLDLTVDPTVPIIRVEPPTTLYARIDPRTRQVVQAIRYILGAKGTPQDGLVQGATLYLPNQTVAWVRDATGQWVVYQQVAHNLGVVPVVPITNRTLLSDLYGTSEITPELRSITDAAARVLMDMQAAAELMGIPQRLLFGVRPQDIGVDPSTGTSRYDAYMARILAFEEAEGKAFQFNAAELRNFCDALDQLDRKAAAYTGLPPQYLSYSSQNPASAEAISASEARLVKKCERKNISFGGAWEQAMRIAYAAMNGGFQSLPPEYFRLEAVWREPSTPTYAAKADAATKLYANGAGVVPKERARIDMGYTIAEREEMQIWDQQEAQQLIQALGAPGGPRPGNPGAGTGGGSGGDPAQPTETKTVSKSPTDTTQTVTASPKT
ncbi:MAG: phage portal protein [Isosphaeraceae bacterium]